MDKIKRPRKDVQHPSCCASIELLTRKCTQLEAELEAQKKKNSLLQSDLETSKKLIAEHAAEIARLTMHEDSKLKAEKCEKQETLFPQRFARDILPTEVWELIFNEVPSWEDLKRCCQVSQTWKEILEPRQTEWMMDEVFRLIVNQLPRKEILKYRLVCRRWCRAIDLYLTNDQYNKYEENLSVGLVGYQFPRKFFQTDFGPWWGREKPIVKFMEDMKGHRHNPFIGRSLRVCVRHGNQKFLQLLRKFGHYLETLEIFFEFTERSSLSETHTLPRVKYICDCLEQLQNLKRLGLFFTIYIGPHGIPGFRPGPTPFKNADKEEVNKFFSAHTVPVPPSIQKIGYKVETFYDGGAFQEAFNRAAYRRRIMYAVVNYSDEGLHYDAMEDWYLKKFRVIGY